MTFPFFGPAFPFVFSLSFKNIVFPPLSFSETSWASFVLVFIEDSLLSSRFLSLSLLCAIVSDTVASLCLTSQCYMVLVPDPTSGKPRPSVCDWPPAAGFPAWKRSHGRPQDGFGESSSQRELRLRQHRGYEGGAGRFGLLWRGMQWSKLLQERRTDGHGCSSPAAEAPFWVRWLLFQPKRPRAALLGSSVGAPTAAGADRSHTGAEEHVVAEDQGTESLRFWTILGQAHELWNKTGFSVNFLHTAMKYFWCI